MKIRLLIKNPKYCEVWGALYGNKIGLLAQGIPGLVKGKNTIMFINK